MYVIAKICPKCGRVWRGDIALSDYCSAQCLDAHTAHSPAALDDIEALEQEKIAYLEALERGTPPPLESLSPEMVDFALTAVELRNVEPTG